MVESRLRAGSTVTVGCEPCRVKAAASRASVVVHWYACAGAGDVAAKAMRRVAPGQSSFAVPGGATAWITAGAASSVTVQVTAEQLPAAVVAAPSVAASTANPAGTTTWALFAALLELLRLASATVYVLLTPGRTALGLMVAP